MVFRTLYGLTFAELAAVYYLGIAIAVILNTFFETIKVKIAKYNERISLQEFYVATRESELSHIYELAERIMAITKSKKSRRQINPYIEIYSFRGMGDMFPANKG